MRIAKSKRTIEKAHKQAQLLENEYNAPVVWAGGDKFIVVKGGEEITVDLSCKKSEDNV